MKLTPPPFLIFPTLLAACDRGATALDASVTDAGVATVADAHATDASRDAAVGASDASVIDPPGAIRFDRAWRTATHNSYWYARSATSEFGASGTQERLLDQLLFEDVRAIELDVHRDRESPGVFRVYHTDQETDSLCSPLSECVRMLRTFHALVPRHEGVVVVVELKEIQDSNFDATHTPDDLDAVFAPLGASLFTPRELLARCPGASDLRACVASAAWPAVDEMRGRFVLALIGNWRNDLTQTICRAAHPNDPCPPRAGDVVVGHGPSDWVTYASGDMLRRAAFPMRSNWVLYNGGADTERVDVSQLARAERASVIWQVEDLADPSVAGFVASHGLVRGADSFAPDEQRARIAAGFQLVQTDHPWSMIDPRGPMQPFRALRARDGDDAMLREPGERLVAHAASDGRPMLATETVSLADGACTTWQTAVAVGRAATDVRYPSRVGTPGTGCLAARASLGSDTVALCRSADDTGHAVITWSTVVAGTRRDVPVTSSDRTADGVGELLALEVCVRAGTTTVHARSTQDPAMPWTDVGAPVTFATALTQQGLEAIGDVRFVATRRDGVTVRASDLAVDDGTGTLDDATVLPAAP